MIKGLYIHIPFCQKICIYCDFIKMVSDEELKKDYVQMLVRELFYNKDMVSDIKTIYIGGGTPSYLNKENLEYILKNINELIDFNNIEEFTIEANPNDISLEFMRLIKKYNVNRLSIGVQTTNDKLLNFLNRTHSKQDIIKAISIIEEAKFDNYNLDFIYGIPNQTTTDVLDDLKFIKKIKPNHISYYSLIIEERTQLKYLIDTKKVISLSDDKIADFSDLVNSELNTMGYKRYEFSNYSLPNYISKHNMIYWNLEEYLGIGLGAASQFNKKRYINNTLISEYLKNQDFIKEEEEFIPEMEYILMGLRKIEGINLKEYHNKFGIEVLEKYPLLNKHIKNELLELNKDWLRFSTKGIDLSNQVYIDIIEVR